VDRTPKRPVFALVAVCMVRVGGATRRWGTGDAVMTGRPNRGTGVPSDPSRAHANGFDRRHPPFGEGNVVAVRHGANSPRAIAVRAAEVHEELLEVAPWLDRTEFLPAVHRYLQAAAYEQLLIDYVNERGVGNVAPRVLEQKNAATNTASKLAKDLGLDPIGHARLRAVAGAAEVTALTLADLELEGRRIRERRELTTNASSASEGAPS